MVRGVARRGPAVDLVRGLRPGVSSARRELLLQRHLIGDLERLAQSQDHLRRLVLEEQTRSGRARAENCGRGGGTYHRLDAEDVAIVAPADVVFGDVREMGEVVRVLACAVDVTDLVLAD